MRTITKTILEAAKDGIKTYGSYYLIDKREVHSIFDDLDGLSKTFREGTPNEAVEILLEVLENHEGYCDKMFAEEVVSCLLGVFQEDCWTPDQERQGPWAQAWGPKTWADLVLDDERMNGLY